MSEIQNTMNANKQYTRNVGNVTLNTDNIVNTAKRKIYTEIFRIWIAVLTVKGELPLPMHPNIFFALYNTKKIEINSPRQQIKKNTHCPKLSVCPDLTAVCHASWSIFGEKADTQMVMMIPTDNAILNIPKIIHPTFSIIEARWADFFNVF